MVLDNITPENWELSTSVGRQSQQSIYLNNFDVTTPQTYEFMSTSIDASILSDIAISFDYAYSKSAPTVFESLKFAVSDDCGQTWVVRKTYLGAGSLITYDTELATPFFPIQDDQWKNGLITNIPSNYLVDNLMVKFIFNAAGGNNIFIDNIQIAHPDVLDIQNSLLENVKIYPNPATDKVTLEMPNQVTVESIELTETNGKKLQANYAKNTDGLTISMETLRSGVYF